jgi:hypothetical protein
MDFKTMSKFNIFHPPVTKMYSKDVMRGVFHRNILFTLVVIVSGCTAPVPIQVTSTPHLTSTGVFTLPSSTPQPNTPSPLPIPTETEVLTSSRTAVPHEPTVGPSQFAPLASQGPYLAFLLDDESGSSMLLLDTAGGRKVIPLPPNSIPFGFNHGYYSYRLLSPNGEWLAYYSGQMPEYGEEFSKYSGAFDLTLNLMHLPDGAIYPITPLLSADFPANFTRQLGALELSGRTNPYPDMDNVILSFMNGIFALDWSPDSTTLAFAGEIEGPSSDLYLYDVETGTIRRLTDGPENIQWIRFSPEGEHILHASAYYLSEGESNAYHVASVSDGSVKTLLTFM